MTKQAHSGTQNSHSAKGTTEVKKMSDYETIGKIIRKAVELSELLKKKYKTKSPTLGKQAHEIESKLSPFIKKLLWAVVQFRNKAKAAHPPDFLKTEADVYFCIVDVLCAKFSNGKHSHQALSTSTPVRNDPNQRNNGKVLYEDDFRNWLVRARGNAESTAKSRRSNLRRVAKKLKVTVSPEWIRSVNLSEIEKDLAKAGIPSRKPGKSSSPLDDCMVALRAYLEMCEERNLR